MWNVGISIPPIPSHLRSRPFPVVSDRVLDQTLVLFLYPPAPVGYGFSNLAAGLFYIAPMVAVIVGELFGHFFSTVPIPLPQLHPPTP